MSYLEEMLAVVVSTGHLTKADAEELARVDIGRELLIYVGEYGWIVYAEAERHACEAASPDLRLSASFWNLLGWAQRQGYDWIRFDRDADAVEGLEVFDW